MITINESESENDHFELDNFGQNNEIQEEPKCHQISIAWQNLCCEVVDGFVWTRRKKKKKLILNRLNGFFECNTLNGVMGPSGAGKTTLLKCLSGNGQVLCDGSPMYISAQDGDCPVSYFIAQHVHESIVARMTVGDILRYAFRFKNRSCDQMDEHINKTMRELMLPERLCNRRFGVCSGGEQKRIAIAQELMSLRMPEYLLVDEPTTGLDSAAAFQVINCLKQLTIKYRITVIASIHQPNQEILNLFDKLYVLAKGGLAIYSGAPNQIEHQLKQQIEMIVPSEQPPIEALIKIACDDLNNANVLKLTNHFISTEFECVAASKSLLKSLSTGLPNVHKSFSPHDFFTQFSRQFSNTFVSNFGMFIGQIMFYILNVVILSSMFNSEMVEPSGCYSLVDGNTTCLNEFAQNSLLNENISFHVFCGAIMGFVVTCSSTLNFASMVNVFRNEHRNRWYSLGVFYWSMIMVSLLEVTILSVAISSTAYLSTEQHAIDQYSINWTRFVHYAISVWLLCIYTQSLGQMIGVIITNSSVIAVVTSVMIYMILDIMSDFLFKTDDFDSQLMVQWSNVVAIKYVTKYMIYAIYGLDRCEQEKEFSATLLKNHVDAEDIVFYFYRVLTNAIVFKVIALVVMYCKFGNLKLAKCRSNSRNSKLKINQSEPLTLIEFDSLKIDLENGNINSSQTQVVQKSASTTISIAWRDLNMCESNSVFKSCRKKDEDSKMILRNLNGQFCFGTLNALMGTSGAGKTSLLKILNGRCKSRLSDSTRFYLSRFTKIETCFITQEVSGHLMPGLTAKQFLVYASRLKNLNLDVDHEKIALNILDELDLMATINTKLNLCSGGERKRLALAAELTATVMPNLVCIDEPSSGLDSNSAETVVSCLSKLTQLHPITILASIHQPNTSILSMFDQLYVLSRDGVCIYSGPPNQISSHLNQISEISNHHESNFPIEQLIKYSCSDSHQDQIVHKLSDLTNQQFVDIDSHLIDNTKQVSNLSFNNSKSFSFKSTYILCQRYFSLLRGHLWKEWFFFSIILICYAYSLLLFWKPTIAQTSGCVNGDDYFNQTCDQNEQKLHLDKDLDDSLKFNFFMNNIFLLLILLHSSLTLFREIGYFYNEHRNGWYSSGSFYLMKCLVEILPLLPTIFIYLYISNIYSSVLPGIYWSFLLIMLISILSSQGMAHMIVLLSNNNITIITLIFMIVYENFLLLSNFFISVNRLNVVYRLVSNFSISRFAFESVLVLVYGFDRCNATQGEIQPIMTLMELTDDYYYHCIWMLLTNIVLFRVLSFGLLIFKSNSLFKRH